MLLLAFELIKSNHGVNTPGVRSDTLDGTSLLLIDKIRNDLKTGTFKFTPSRQVIIPKAGGRGIRPLEISSQKIVQKVLEMALSCI